MTSSGAHGGPRGKSESLYRQRTRSLRHGLLQAVLTFTPGVGETVMYLGMMAEYFGHQRNRPIARFGRVALNTDEKISTNLDAAHYYVAELQTYPGHSGGPVWVVREQTLVLIGVMAGVFLACNESWRPTKAS